MQPLSAHSRNQSKDIFAMINGYAIAGRIVEHASDEGKSIHSIYRIAKMWMRQTNFRLITIPCSSISHSHGTVCAEKAMLSIRENHSKSSHTDLGHGTNIDFA